MEAGAEALYRRALSRLSPQERAREGRRGGAIPYPLSLHALAGYFWETGGRQGWLPAGGPLLAAVSGGGDSMALLWLFRTLYEGPLVAAHVNHGLRGAEADEDAALARETAEGWGLPFLERRVDAGGERRRGESLEAAARRVRHRELLGLAGECGAAGILLGHNRDDLAETALFHILRGTGPRGGAGIPERRGPFIRPLMGLRREFLRRVLALRGIPWREDSTNAAADCTRNFLRLELLPLIEARVNAGAVEHLAAFAEAMRRDREEEERRGAGLLEGALLGGAAMDGALRLDRGRAAALSPPDRALLAREAGRRLGLPALSRRRSQELARLMARPGPFTFQWGGGGVALGENGEIQIIRYNR